MATYAGVHNEALNRAVRQQRAEFVARDLPRLAEVVRDEVQGWSGAIEDEQARSAGERGLS